MVYWKGLGTLEADQKEVGMRDIAILGCGPAGLLTALAVEQAGYSPVIYSIPRKSPLNGAQFLHEFIEGASELEDLINIEFRKVGSKEGYAQKVYHDKTAPTSWDAYPSGNVRAWSLAAAYDRLWERYSDGVVAGEITARLLDGIEQRYAAAFSTIPVPAICEADHDFRFARVWIRQLTTSSPTDNFIEYNGDPTKGYYRTSAINGHWSSEFGHPALMADPGKKPLTTNCDCRPFFHRVGRFGRWSKGVLVNHAYHDAQRVLNAL